MDGDVAVVERPPGRRRQPPTITVSLQDGEPLLALSLEYDDHDTPQADIANEVVALARAAPWILPQPQLTTPSPEEAEEPSPHRLRSPAAALLEAHRPGPELARKLERTSLADADDAPLVEVVAAWEREDAWADRPPPSRRGPSPSSADGGRQEDRGPPGRRCSSSRRG